MATRIESGTTAEHRIRIGIFLGMCVVFALYFGYDGLYGYPNQNLKWARQSLRTMVSVPAEQADTATVNNKVVKANLDRVRERVRDGMTEAELKELLGEPAAVSKAELGTVTHWYVGPAALVGLALRDGRVTAVQQTKENPVKSENDIFWQKAFGIGVGLIALLTGLYFIRISTMRTVLDDQGLSIKGKRMAWDEITGLDTTDYSRKGWLDVLYQREGRQLRCRLDSYHTRRFDDIVNELCARKGIPSPIVVKAGEHDEPEDTAAQ